MLFLVTDTSGKDGFVGLVRAGEGAESGEVVVIEEVPLTGGTFSAQLVPQISRLLAQHGFRRDDIDAFIVVSGPGSFTGLRVGLAAIKALAEILQKPIVPLSLLEVIAHSFFFVAERLGDDKNVRYAVALDAGRGEAFVGRYEIAFEKDAANSLRCEGESLLQTQSLAESIKSGTTPRLITTDAALVNALERNLDLAQKSAVLLQSRPRSAEVAAVGWQKLRAGSIVSPEQLEANYIRRSDQEIFAKPS